MGMAPGVVRIGGMTKSQLLAELELRGVQLNEIALQLFAHADFAVSNVAVQLRVADTTVGELGHPGGATIAELFASAAARGWSLCPLELAPHLRLQFMDQPEGEWGHPPSQHRAPPGSITVASRLLVADDGRAMGFYLRRIRGVAWLRGYRAPLDHVWSADDRFVLCSGFVQEAD